MSGKLYVGNLWENATGAELQAFFAAFGAVKWADVASDQETGQSKGFGFVQMATESDTRSALAGANGKQHGGRLLRVSHARPRGAQARRVAATVGGGRKGVAFRESSRRNRP